MTAHRLRSFQRLAARLIAAASLLNATFVERFGSRMLSHWALIGFTTVAAVHALISMAGHETIWIFGVLLMSWIVKVTIHPYTPNTLRELYFRIQIGPIPAWLVLLTGVFFNTFIIALAVTTLERSSDEAPTRQETRDRMIGGELAERENGARPTQPPRDQL